MLKVGLDLRGLFQLRQFCDSTTYTTQSLSLSPLPICSDSNNDQIPFVKFLELMVRIQPRNSAHVGLDVGV